MSSQKHRGNKGFTLIEILVVLSIISLLTILTFTQYRTGQKSFALQRAAHQMAQDIRRAQEMAMSAKECFPEICGEIESIIPDGYGVYFETGLTNYDLYADRNSNERYDGSDSIVEEDIELEKGIYIEDVSPSFGV